MDVHNEIHHNILNDISRLLQKKKKSETKKYTSDKRKHNYRAELQRMFEYEFK